MKQVIDRYGGALLDDRPRCKALLADYAKGKYMPQRRLLMRTLKSGFHTEIARTSDPAGIKARFAGALEHRHLIAPQAAEAMILLLKALFHKPMTPRTPPPPRPAPQPALSKDEVTLVNRGNTYFDKGDYDRAIADYSAALRINPNHADAYYNRGTAYSDKEDNDRAIADYSAALRINPNYALAKNNLEIARRALGW